MRGMAASAFSGQSKQTQSGLGAVGPTLAATYREDYSLLRRVNSLWGGSEAATTTASMELDVEADLGEKIRNER